MSLSLVPRAPATWTAKDSNSSRRASHEKEVQVIPDSAVQSQDPNSDKKKLPIELDIDILMHPTPGHIG